MTINDSAVIVSAMVVPCELIAITGIKSKESVVLVRTIGDHGRDSLHNWTMLFHFFPDEISFNSKELMGLTVGEAHNLYQARDNQFVPSH